MSAPVLAAPVRGAVSSVTLTTDSALANATGGYFINGKPKVTPKKRGDVAVVEKIFAQVSSCRTLEQPHGVLAIGVERVTGIGPA